MSKEVPWRCFHCDEVLTDRASAQAHFGLDGDSQPACVIKGSDGGLLRAYREAEQDALEAWRMIHSESGEALQAWRNADARHTDLLVDAEQRGYDRGVQDRAGEVGRLRRIVAHYGDKVRMSMCHRSDWQIEIDEAMRFVAGNPEPEARP